MRTARRIAGLAAAPLLLAGLGAVLPPSPGAQDGISDELVEAFRANPMEFFFEQQPFLAIQAAEILLRDEALPAGPRAEILTTLGTIYVAQSNDAAARAAFMEWLAEDPDAELWNPVIIPMPVKQLFYSLRDSISIARNLKRSAVPKTLAVGNIENNSVFAGEFDLDRFARGLVHLITADLSSIPGLTLVDRQRLDVLRDEIGLNKDADILDPETAVAFGNLTGAGSFIFGSLMLVDEHKIRIDLRLVETETSDVLLAESQEGTIKKGSDLVKLEQKLVAENLAGKIQEMLETEGANLKRSLKDAIQDRDETDYLELVLATGRAVLAEEEGDMEAAAAAWSEVAGMDPSDTTARDRSRALSAFMTYATKE